jgi:SOS-response transcriptional repressor LexA
VLTKTLAKLLAYIVKLQEQFGFSPSLQEMSTEMGWVNRNSSHYVLKRLQDRGFIKITKAKSRSVEVLKAGIFHTSKSRVP